MEIVAERLPLAEFAKGDLDAFEAIFRRSQAEVYGWIVRIVRDAAIAEDLTIETFWRAYKAHARFDPTRNFHAWIRRIATNLAIGYIRRAPPPMIALSGESATTSDSDDAVQRDTRYRVQTCFYSLPVKLRVPALLALVEERPHREIAEALGITEAAVKSRVFRATQLLRRKLSEMGITP